MKNHTIPADEGLCLDSCQPDSAEIVRFRSAIKAISGKWKIEIMAMLADGPRRFGDLRRSLPGITQHMLTAQLRDLGSTGLVVRTAFAEIPPRVDYELTEAAYALLPVFTELLRWSKNYTVPTGLVRPKGSHLIRA